MISGFNRVTRKGQDVAQPQGMGSHQVGLQGNAVCDRGRPSDKWPLTPSRCSRVDATRDDIRINRPGYRR